MKVGIDLVSIKKFHKIKIDDFSHWNRVYSKAEWKIAYSASTLSNVIPALKLASMFAIKEAAMKATGLVGPNNFRRFEISYNKDGAPAVSFKGSAVSVSHQGEYLVAVVIIQ